MYSTYACSHALQGGHLTLGCGEMGGQSCLQRMVVGTEAKEIGLEHDLGGDKGARGGHSL
jgi:hypothetical protein